MEQETKYTFKQAVAAFMAMHGMNEQDARLHAWIAGPIKGDEAAAWYEETRSQLNNTEHTVAAAALWDDE